MSIAQLLFTKKEVNQGLAISPLSCKGGDNVGDENSTESTSRARACMYLPYRIKLYNVVVDAREGDNLLTKEIYIYIYFFLKEVFAKIFVDRN